ncbi:MAG: L,D-transpeptidase [Gammaproteobacteria bacterium]|nr:L,D-transpeptidase [Gammaproteobacteria bacterium]
MNLHVQVNIQTQQLHIVVDEQIIQTFIISTAKKGRGQINGSEQTPEGKHIIRAKIGNQCPLYTVFVGRRPTGEVFSPLLKARFPDRDWILTRIFWLSGLEKGKNRLGEVDTMRRYIYLHGTSDENSLGFPSSHGCIRMANLDIMQLFDQIPVGTLVHIS